MAQENQASSFSSFLPGRWWLDCLFSLKISTLDTPSFFFLICLTHFVFFFFSFFFVLQFDSREQEGKKNL